MPSIDLGKYVTSHSRSIAFQPFRTHTHIYMCCAILMCQRLLAHLWPCAIIIEITPNMPHNTIALMPPLYCTLVRRRHPQVETHVLNTLDIPYRMIMLFICIVYSICWLWLQIATYLRVFQFRWLAAIYTTHTYTLTHGYPRNANCDPLFDH